MATHAKVGSLATDSLTSLKSGATCTTASGNYDTMEVPVGSDFSASGGVFYITHVIAMSATAGVSFRVGYGDTGVDDSASAPTNPVFLTDDLVIPTLQKPEEYNLFLAVPVGKFPFVQGTSSATIATQLEGHQS